MFNKKTISPVVATALLLVVAVLTIVGFQDWFQTYSSNVFTKVESDSSTNSNLQIESIIGKNLYIKNLGQNNLTINKVKISGIDCNINKNISKSMVDIDLNNCNSTIPEGQNEIVIYTDNGIISKYIYLSESISKEPIINFNINISTSLRHNTNVPFNISWNVLNADSCSATLGDWSVAGSKNLNGSEIYNIDGDMIFTLSCNGFDKTVIKTVSLLGKINGGIYDCFDLQNMKNDISGTYNLMNNIDCSITSTWNWNGTQYLGFEPIGSIFNGELFGNNKIIDSLYINRSQDEVGIFKRLGTATISDLIFKKFYIEGLRYVSTLSGGATPNYKSISNIKVLNSNIFGNADVGGLIGTTSTNTYLSNLSIIDTKITALIYNAGGIAGSAALTGSINNSYISNLIINSSGTVGGLVASCQSDFEIFNSYAINSILIGGRVGGVIGYQSSANINNTFVSNLTISGSSVGGITGHYLSGFTENSFWNINNTLFVGSDTLDSGIGTGKTTAEMKTAQTFRDTSWDENIWLLQDGEYPKLTWE